MGRLLAVRAPQCQANSAAQHRIIASANLPTTPRGPPPDQGPRRPGVCPGPGPTTPRGLPRTRAHDAPGSAPDQGLSGTRQSFTSCGSLLDPGLQLSTVIQSQFEPYLLSVRTNRAPHASIEEANLGVLSVQTTVRSTKFLHIDERGQEPNLFKICGVPLGRQECARFLHTAVGAQHTRVGHG